VHLAEMIIPAADLSEQISTAGTEASGTGNMKFALNGALTIGTWDGANIEMAQAMGADNMFVFGLRADEVSNLWQAGYRTGPVREARCGAAARARRRSPTARFSPDEPGRYRGLTDELLQNDGYMLMADFGSYRQARSASTRCSPIPPAWARSVVANIAAMGRFSSDRTVRDYLERGLVAAGRSRPAIWPA
jgi:starch phosphorylase